MSNPTRESLLKNLPDYETKEGKIISKDQVAEYERIYNSSAYPVYDFEQVDQILTAETKAQQSCEMCHAPITGREYTINDYREQIKIFISKLDFNAISNIKYCQWCGRKLKHLD